MIYTNWIKHYYFKVVSNYYESYHDRYLNNLLFCDLGEKIIIFDNDLHTLLQDTDFNIDSPILTTLGKRVEIIQVCSTSFSVNTQRSSAKNYSWRFKFFRYSLNNLRTIVAKKNYYDTLTNNYQCLQ